MSFEIKQKISDRIIKSLLCCAIDPGNGGAEYWCTVMHYRFKEGLTLEDFGEGGKMQGDEYWHPNQLVPLTEGCSLLIEDRVDKAENRNSRLLRLNQAAIQKGLEVMAEKYPEHFAHAMDIYRADGETGDVFLQCCLFGEVVYG